MEKLTNKKYLIIIVFIILLVSIFIIFSKDRNKGENWSNNFNKSILAISESQSPRYLAINKLLNNNFESIKKESLTKDNSNVSVFSVTYNYSNEFTNHINDSDDNKKHRGGVIIFRVIDKYVEKIWESQEIIQGLSNPGVKFLDIDNDGFKEIVVTVPQSNIYENLYIYKFKDENFNLISPLVEEEYTKIEISEIYGTSPVEISDKNNDKIMEISTRELVDIIPGAPGDNPGAGRLIIKTYKFNGEVYELWKEEKTPDHAS